MDALRNKSNELTARGRMVSIALRLALVFFLLLPSVFVALEANHDCNGPECAICQCVQAAESLLDSIGSGSVAAAVSVILSLTFVALAVSAGRASHSFTLIQQKVRLDI